ncbi:MAG: TatD family hydrolase [Opitutaceae bacterium]|nr:TatD family hydrolase [Opitutaceae bacterium]
MLHDAHNHLHDAWLAPHLATIAADLERLPVAGAVVNGTCETDWPEVTALAAAHAWVRPSYGLHPWDVGNATPAWRAALVRTLDANPRGAVGEIGLDRWILERARPDDPRLAGLRRAPLAEQTEAFVWQLSLAAERNLPATLHCLEAWGALMETLRATPRPARGFLLHAYGGPAEMVAEFAALGAYFSFNGGFLAARHAAKRAVFAAIPGDRLLVETDAPAMALPADLETHTLPALADGTRVNHPGNLAAAYVGLAAIRRVPLAELTAQVARNFARLFG